LNNNVEDIGKILKNVEKITDSVPSKLEIIQTDLSSFQSDLSKILPLTINNQNDLMTVTSLIDEINIKISDELGKKIDGIAEKNDAIINRIDSTTLQITQIGIDNGILPKILDNTYKLGKLFDNSFADVLEEVTGTKFLLILLLIVNALIVILLIFFP
jgi:hypothetical protein